MGRLRGQRREQQQSGHCGPGPTCAGTHRTAVNGGGHGKTRACVDATRPASGRAAVRTRAVDGHCMTLGSLPRPVVNSYCPQPHTTAPRHVHRGAYRFVRRFRDRRLPWGWSRDSVKRSGAVHHRAGVRFDPDDRLPTDRRHRGRDHRAVTAVLVHRAHLELVGRPRRRGARDPPAGRRRLRSMEKDGRPEGKAGGQAAMAGRTAPAAEAQSWPRRFGAL